MLIFILIDVQYIQNAIFCFEKGSNRQNHYSSGSHHLVNPPPLTKISNPPDQWWGMYPPPPPPLTAIWKTLYYLVKTLK